MTLQEKKDELKERLGKKGRDDFYNLIERKGFVIDEYLENHYLNDEEEYSIGHPENEYKVNYEV